MVPTTTSFSTGLPALDTVLQGLLSGDNVVWQVDSVEDYKPFVSPFCKAAHAQGRKLIYFRFADHPSLIENGAVHAEVVQLHKELGFESFINDIFNIIEVSGKGACYLFDCLSELVVDWYSDRMMGNFFQLACPYLFEFDAVAYFALLRNRHSFHATDSIQEKAQVILDVYHNKQALYIHPLKVYNRHSATLYTLHKWDGDAFLPVTSSATVSEILVGVAQPWLDFTIHRLGEWTRTFGEAAEVYHQSLEGKPNGDAVARYTRRLMRMAVTRDERILQLTEQYLDLSDLLEIRKRMIGTGLIGGKSVGMLLARAILKKADPHWRDILEAHDSFFIGSDVFYTFLVQNRCWWIRRKQKDLDTLLKLAEEARGRMLNGAFPLYIQNQFMEMLNYFGQVPIIVRSSSLLEDNYGNSFSGKYESVFCTNQGTPQERLDAFVNAVLRVYASTMSKEALLYRAQRGLLEREEQMALLIQRVSGDVCGTLFFPQVAGVGYSFNPYVWNSDIDPNVGMLRLVFGLGTRAVDRHDDDYTRIVALNVPSKRPESTFTQVRRYAQQKVDVLNLQKNQAMSIHFEDIVKAGFGRLLDMYASRDEDAERRAQELGLDHVFSWVLTFDKLFSDTPFVRHMSELLRLLHKAYAYPVDIEFAANFLDDGSYRINLLQCRPFQVKKQKGLIVEPPDTSEITDCIFKIQGQILGNSVNIPLDWIIYVVAEQYSNLSQGDRYAIARLIGKLTHLEGKTPEKVMLLGPGRWGTTTPSLGVPVSFAEINTVSVLCEIGLMHEGLVPEISLGTHFFNDFVEMDMVYLGVLPNRTGTVLNIDLLNQAQNLLEQLLPAEKKWSPVVRVIRGIGKQNSDPMYLYVDALKQEALCYTKKKANKDIEP